MDKIFATILMTFGLFTYHPMRQGALASWYGVDDGFHGRITASGSIFDAYAMTLASPGRPLGSWQLIYNPRTGLYALGRVTDRGPFVKGRNLDLSWEMARLVGILDDGVAQLRIRQVDEISMAIIYGRDPNRRKP
jgi:rare lipoprotein A